MKRDPDPFTNGQQSKAKAKADDKKQQQDLKNEHAAANVKPLERHVDKQVDKNLSRPPPKDVKASPQAKKDEKPEKSSEAKSVQKPVPQTPTNDSKTAAQPQPRSVTSFDKETPKRSEKQSQPPQSIEQFHTSSSKRPRVDDLPQKHEPIRQTSFRDEARMHDRSKEQFE